MEEQVNAWVGIVDMKDAVNLFPYILDVERFLCDDMFIATTRIWTNPIKARCRLYDNNTILQRYQGASALPAARFLHDKYDEMRSVFRALHQCKMRPFSFFKVCT